MPRSLAARTALVLLTGLGVVQAAGLAIHALDRINLDRIEQERETGMRVVAIYRSIVETDPSQRDNEVARMRLPSGFKVGLTPGPQTADLDPASLQMQHAMRSNLQMMPFPMHLHPTQVMAGVNHGRHRFEVSMHLPDESRWVSVVFRVQPPNLFSSPTFPIAFTLMIVATGDLDQLGGAPADRAGAHSGRRRRGHWAATSMHRRCPRTARSRCAPQQSPSTPWPRASAALSPTAPCC